MGVSRDFTAEGRGGTATLTRPAERIGTTGRPQRGGEAGAPGIRRPEIRRPGVSPSVPHRPLAPNRGRLGSKQVVSVRGRRVVGTAVKRRFSTVTAVAIPLLLAGVVLAMVLSGMATHQSFTIQQLQSRERGLHNEVESLNRDLEDVRSSASVAKRAGEAGMVVPGEPGIVAVNGAGEAAEQRPADPEAATKVVDVNDTGAAGARRPSSDKNATSEVGENLTPVPGGSQIGRDAGQQTSQQTSQLAPYAPNVPSAPAPVPAPAPAQ